MSEPIRHIIVCCEQCDKPLTALMDVSESGEIADWRHDPTAPWGRGKTTNDSPAAEWYDNPSDSKRRTRSHTDPGNGTLYLICNRLLASGMSRCANRAEFNRATWLKVAQLLAAAGRDRVNISDFRAVASQVGDDTPKRRANR